MPQTGDWQGDGSANIAVFSAPWYIDANSDGTWNGGALDKAYTPGPPGDAPATGRW